ncbi:MAG: DUF4910 domain-containing protein [Candidatus Aminicenantes bacterium]|nr:DUF4910 domain-containing protein [Candidatus Aminicenantes bacterium]
MSKRMLTKILSAAVVLGSAVPVGSVERPLASPKLVQALVDEVSGETAFRYTVRISQFDRIQANAGWHDAAAWIRDELERIGYKDAAIEGWPSNGSTRYYTYNTPIGWKAKSAELWMVEPRRERLCFYEEIPLTLVKHSGPAKVEAELVDVGSGLDEASYRGRDVRGRIVLATGASAAVAREAVMKRGALGVITYYPPEVRPGYPNMIRYTAFWPAWEERGRHGFGFNVSKNQGAVLKRRLEEGQKIVLRAEVEAEFFETKVEILTASLAGGAEPEREVLVVGHLCHPAPSANDNASGSGGMLEMARALKRLVDKGVLPAPRRTIRFLWVPEFSGLVPYIKAHLERTRSTLAAINCDMIGEDLHLTGGTFNITVTPDSNPSYLNDVVVNFARLVDRLGLQSLNGSAHPFAWRVVPFGGGSDHYVFNDGALKVPSVMFGHGDTFHHTSLDMPDKVDPSELRRICAVTLGSAYYIAAAGEAEADETARLVVRNGLGRLAADFYDALDGQARTAEAEALHQAYRQTQNVLLHSARRERAAVLSTAALGGKAFSAAAKKIAAPIEALRASLGAEADKAYRAQGAALKTKPLAPGPTAEEKAAAALIPARNPDFVCPVETDYLVEKLGADAPKNARLGGYAAYEALNYVDGRRSLLDIRNAVSASYGPQSLADIQGYLEVLKEAGLITWKTAPAASAEAGRK